MKLNILGKQVRVLKQHDLSKKMGWAGCYDPEQASIFIDSDLVGDYYHETFNHEFLEAVFDRASFNQSINPQLKEVMIDIISKCLNENFRLVPKKK